MAAMRSPELVNTIEYLGIWEQLYNPNFKPIEFEGFRMQAGLNAFTLSPKKWIETTDAVGISSGVTPTPTSKVTYETMRP